MTSELLIVGGAVVLSLALRSYRNPLVHRIGTFGMLFGVSFLIGWFFLGHIWIGIALAASWLLVPWLEILTRARTLRMPVKRELRHRAAPDSETFPSLHNLTDEIETADFERVDDLGWHYEEQRQFFRIFYQPKSGTEAAVCLIEQGEIAFYYIAITSRARNGGTYLTWNYPFSYGLQFETDRHLNRCGSDAEFQRMLADHRLFLDRKHIAVDAIVPQEPATLGPQMESDMRRQLDHNLRSGILKRDGEYLIRYSGRGLLFLWFQFLRDLVKLS